MNKLFSNHAFKIIFVVIFMLPIMTRGARRAFQSNNNEVQDWLPPGYDETKDFTWFRQRFAKETFILVSWEGCTLDDQRLELFARKIVKPAEAVSEKNPQFFTKVETGQRVYAQLTSPPLSVSEEEAYKRLKGLFIGEPEEASIPKEKWQTCAILTLSEYGKKSLNLRKTREEIFKVAESELGLTRDRVKLGGPPIDSVAISTEGERTLMWLLGPAAIVGLTLAYWCLRSWRLTTMVFATALYAGAISLSVVWYSGGTMNAILLTMPAVVYVAGISGAIHFANYYRDTAVEEGVEGAPARAVHHAWLPCLLSAITTAAGLFSLYTSELIPIQWFGVFSAIGVLATLLLLFFFLPAWMQLWPMKPHSKLDGDVPKAEDLALPVRWRRFLQGVLGYNRVAFAALAVLMIVCGIGLTQIKTSIKLTEMFSPSAQIIHDYRWLEAKLGPLVPLEVIVRLDNRQCDLTMLERMQLLRKVQDRLEGIEGIGNTMSAVTFAPSLKIQRKGPINQKMMAGIVDRKIRDHREEFVENGLLAVEGDEELWRISARVGALNNIDYGVFIKDVKNQIEPVLQEIRDERTKLRATKTAKTAALMSEVTLVAHTEPAATPALQKDAKGPAASAAPAGKTAVEQGKAVKKALKAAAPEIEPPTEGITATYTGLVPLVYKAQREMLDGLAMNFVTDLATIALVMTVVFWDFSAGLILLIPSVFPLVVVFGVMGWLGIVIDVGTIMTPTVALGVSVDDVMHFLIWYRKGLKEGRGRNGAIMLAYEGCARAMYQSWSVLALGLAVFSLSSFVPTQRFGALMFTLLTAALVGNLILLPAVIKSPLGWFFLRRYLNGDPAMKQFRAEPGAGHSEHGGNGRVAPTDTAALSGERIAVDGKATLGPPAQIRRDASHRTKT